MTLSPGVYCTAGGPMKLSAGSLTFKSSSEPENDMWIIQVDSELNIAVNTQMILANGARAENIFWAVSGKVLLDVNSVFQGILNTATRVDMNAGASLNGRIFAGTAVTLIANTITQPPLVSK
jgi:hypothetical protein